MPENIHVQLVWGIGVILLTLILCWAWRDTLMSERDHLRQIKKSQEQTLATMMAKREEIGNSLNRHPARASFLSEKWQQKLFPVIALDEVSRGIDSLDIWLTALSVDQKEVVIEGKAFSREGIDTFVDNLEQSSVFESLIKMQIQPLPSADAENMHQFIFHFQAHDVII